MKGRAFLDIAQELAQGNSEAHWRSACGRAYYALLLEARDVLDAWGFRPLGRDNVHPFVRLRFAYNPDVDLRYIGNALDRLVKLRNQGDYQISTPGPFATSTAAVRAVDWQGIRLPDWINSTPIRRSKRRPSPRFKHLSREFLSEASQPAVLPFAFQLPPHQILHRDQRVLVLV